MNERTKVLADQANLYARSDNSSMLFENYQKRYTEKFAELIVRECATFINVEMSLGGVDGRSLLEHFGLIE